MKTVFGFFIACFFSMKAGAANFTCGNEDLNFKNIYNLPGQGYWMQAMGNCEITYTTVGGVWGRRYNLCDRSEKMMTSDIDPFPLPGTQGEIYVHPGGMAFFRAKDLPNGKIGPIAVSESRRGASLAPFYRDDTLNGDYESVGRLKGDLIKRDGVTVRILLDVGNYRDYNLKKDQATGSIHVTPLGVTKPVCNHFSGSDPRNSGRFYLIPILSRNGTMFAARDVNSQYTNIYSVKDGECNLLSKVPYQTSKVSFSFDNRTVLFTVAQPDRKPHILMAMDIATGKIHPLSGPKEDILYMTSTEDGRIMYTRSLDTANGRVTGEAGILVEMDAEFLKVPRDSSMDQALGAIYSQKCGLTMTIDQQQVVGRRLNQSACKDLVANVAESDLRNLTGPHVTKQELVQKCSTQAQPSYKMESGTQ
jgi:hypothetical protein